MPYCHHHHHCHHQHKHNFIIIMITFFVPIIIIPFWTKMNARWSWEGRCYKWAVPPSPLPVTNSTSLSVVSHKLRVKNCASFPVLSETEWKSDGKQNCLNVSQPMQHKECNSGQNVYCINQLFTKVQNSCVLHSVSWMNRQLKFPEVKTSCGLHSVEG